MDLMERDVRERFERIEQILERVTVSHLELEAAQRNTAVLLNKFIVAIFAIRIIASLFLPGQRLKAQIGSGASSSIPNFVPMLNDLRPW
jgi:hypothetical protein